MNPEFQRNLYLELSIARLAGMPAFLLVIFSLTYLIDDKTLSEATANTAIGLFVALVLFWGAKQSAESIFDELRGNTWDIQKTSAISPWSLAWGKLFGSTIYNWYGGLLCLLMYTVATPDRELLAQTWVYSLSCGLLAQALSMLVSLFSLRRKQSFNTGFSYLFVLFALFFIMPVMLNIDEFQGESLEWYGGKYEVSSFIVTSLLLACFWSIVGIYRLLAEELRIRTLPWVWLCFIIFLVVYFSGIIMGTEEEMLQKPGLLLMLVNFCICVTLTYLLLFMDENSPMLARQLWVHTEQEQWLRILQELPCWVISVILALPSMVLLTLLFPSEKVDDMNVYPLVIYLLMLRDAGILLFFSYAPNPKRAMGLTLLYMTCLYGLLPAIFFGMDAEVLAGVILPVFHDNMLLAIVFASIQTSIVGFLLFQRWQGRISDVKRQTLEY